METIKVNMNPNPLDVQTIHASQNDTEARQWEFEMHNNGELIDTSEITEQLFFKAYKGGTEQLLPENGSTPTTSPFKGDIKYPQWLMTDQEFTYRQSPTESDGLAKFTSIKGNTLVWNQLVAKGNMTDGWTFSNATGYYADNVLTFTASAESGFVRPDSPQNIIANHKYLGIIDIKGVSSFATYIYFTGDNDSHFNVNVTTNWQTVARVFTNSNTTSNWYPRIFDTRKSGWDAVQIRNCMLFDLTQMGLDITEPSEFTSLFSLPYYAYNAGTLLSFNGTGVKTVGKNLFNQEWESGSIDSTTGEPVANAYIDRFKDYIRVFPNTRYYYWYEDIGNNMPIYYYDGDKNYLGRIIAYSGNAFVTPSDCCFIRGAIANGQGLPKTLIQKYGTDREYESYTSYTLDLPISTYFPTGMKSAGTVYDELTPTKGITRIGAVDLGSLNWTYDSSIPRFISSDIVSAVAVPSNNSNIANIKCAVYDSISLNGLAQSNKCIAVSTSGVISVKDTAYTSASAFKSSLSGTYLYYELATETETSFTTASLVTENAEIPLSNEDGVLIGKCTEQLSENPGFIDAKIKLSDADGECYSNKIQLHVERSPQ